MRARVRVRVSIRVRARVRFTAVHPGGVITTLGEVIPTSFSLRPIMRVLDCEHRCGLKKRVKRSGIVAVAATSVESELYSMRPLTCGHTSSVRPRRAGAS